ncbi:MAG: hypothetical protein Q9227_008956 [Pyrenula ochraceoflavens]
MDGVRDAVFMAPYRTLNDEPIDERAWTLQERLLATRYLAYGTLQTQWFCPSTDFNNSLTDGGISIPCEANKVFDSEVFARAASTLSALINLPGDGTPRPDDYCHVWYNLVEEHSRRSLSLERDRLRSLAGIAERFTMITGDEYVCGHWKSDLRASLLWITESPPACAPIDYVAPSWSWAAKNIPVRVIRIQPSNNFDPRYQIRGFGVCLEDPQCRFGAVRSGYLEVEGLLLAMTWNFKFQNGKIEFDRHDQRISYSSRFYQDTLEAESLAGDAGLFNFYVLVDWVDVYKRKRIDLDGLALEQPSDGSYSRLGTINAREFFEGSLDTLQWLYTAAPQKIRIV